MLTTKPSRRRIAETSPETPFGHHGNMIIICDGRVVFRSHNRIDALKWLSRARRIMASIGQTAVFEYVERLDV